MLEEHSEAIRDLQKELDDVRHMLTEKEKENEVMEAEINTQKEANTRAPTITMKNMVERLKNQLSLKEKQQKVRTSSIYEKCSFTLGYTHRWFTSDVVFFATRAHKISSAPCTRGRFYL